MNEFTTPMMKQYQEIKAKYADCLLFFRLGDFYELFMDDAKIGAEVLGITLTGRPRGKDGKIPMAGVPYHAVDSYLNKLVRAGYKVAICEQLSEPDKKGIVERDVIRVVTPGTIIDERALEKKEHNYILAVNKDKNRLAIAVADFSTGQLQTQEYSAESWKEVLKDEITRILPTECILPDHLYNDIDVLKTLKVIPDITIFLFSNWEHSSVYAKEDLKTHFGVSTLESFDLEDKPLAQKTCNALLTYLKETQKNNLPHINSITIIPSKELVLLNRATVVNLEIFTTIRGQNIEGSLLYTIDKTRTAMGGRLLRSWIIHPVTSKKLIEERYDANEELIRNQILAAKIDSDLKEIIDIERTFSRIGVGLGNARDLVSLKTVLEIVLSIKKTITKAKSGLLKKQEKEISIHLHDLVDYIENTIVEDPPIQLKDGGILKEKVNTRLDELREIVHKGKKWIALQEAKERKETGISSLKIKYNSVFGYFIEVSKSNLSLVPSHYFRKQTLVNGERFITESLKEMEEVILRAEDEIKRLEYEIYKEVQEKVIKYVLEVQNAAHAVATIDCILSFAKVAREYNYIRPTIVYSNELTIIEGRHPVVERKNDSTQFVPNSTSLGSPKQSLMLLTGPNMAGKSVYLRQVALITLLAHIGSFVPAKKAYIPIVDSIFVRSGANDMITSGLSTFMVEMVETAFILNHVTSKSLIIMDEVGRGTSTYDGVSISWAIAEYLIKKFTPSPKTLFATHYHELIDLAHQYPKKIFNAHMEVSRSEKEPTFTHVLSEGPAYESYGVDVAKLAGIPESVVNRANNLLTEFHTKNTSGNNAIAHIDVENITPIEAMNLLISLKNGTHTKTTS